MVVEIEEGRKILGTSIGMTRVGQARSRIPNLIKEGVDHGVNGRQALSRGVLEQLGD